MFDVSNSKDNMGDRMKGYEALQTERRFMPLLPIYARIDGRCFSRFTEGFARPFDTRITRTMVETTKYLVEQTHACIGYTQSDEISLAWYQEERESELLFGGKVAKLTSVLAGMASSKFALQCMSEPALAMRTVNQIPHFDCRVFQLPNLTEAANVFLWRERDATKNAVSMAARYFYSHKQLHGKRSSEMQEMIFQKGQNFNDYPAFFKRGTFVRRVVEPREFTAEELANIPANHRPLPGTIVERACRRNRHAFLHDGRQQGRRHIQRRRAYNGENLMNAVWMPIDTAPKDGTKILAKDGDDIYVTSWFKGSYGFGRPLEGWLSPDSADELGPFVVEPDYWTALPSGSEVESTPIPAKEREFYFTYSGYNGESYEGPYADFESAKAAAILWVQENPEYAVDIIELIEQITA